MQFPTYNIHFCCGKRQLYQSRRRIIYHAACRYKVLLIRKNWNKYIDELWEDLIASGVTVEDFDMFNLNAYNRAAQENVPIITVDGWEDVHPLLKIISADWEYRIPFGILYSPTPTKQVKDFINTLMKISKE